MTWPGGPAIRRSGKERGDGQFRANSLHGNPRSEHSMKNLGQMMKQAQEIQAKMAAMQDELASTEVSGSAGGGMVEVTLNGKAEARKVRIDPSLVDPSECEVLEDLIVAAFNDAKVKVESRVAEITGGLKLPPGMQFPL
jgi:nucleoid-associated protein EbfC